MKLEEGETDEGQTLVKCASLQTLVRKFRKSLTQRGMLATACRLLTKPMELVRRFLREMSPSHRRCRREELDFDRHMQVETSSRSDAGWMARIHSSNWVHGIGYAPVPLRDGRSILAGLNICYEEYVCIDIGAGKGRVLFLAAEFPFREIVGVEYSPDLYATLERNVESFCHPARRCQRIETMLRDATQFTFPTDPLVLFFHHPFDETLFRQVLARIEHSLKECPRDIRVIYYDPICGELFRCSEFFEELQHGERDPTQRCASSWTVYGSRIPASSPKLITRAD